MTAGRLRTEVCDLLDIRFPVVLAGMDKASTPALIAAVGEAGGLGVLGAASLEPDELDQWIAETRRRTSRPFGVNTLLPTRVPPQATQHDMRDSIPEEYWRVESEIRQRLDLPRIEVAERPKMFSNDFFEKQMEVIIDNEVPVYAAGLGDPERYVPALHGKGTKVIGMVGNVKNARRVINSGVDLVVAQGYEAGGHNSRIGTMALIPQVVDAVGGRVPVLAAGGIGDGRGVIAALALGAQGAWIGTRFLATTEAGIAEGQKAALVSMGEDDTTISRYWTGKPTRVIRSPLWEELESSKLPPLGMPRMGILTVPLLEDSISAKRFDLWPGSAGQIAGLITAIQPAGEVYRSIVAEAEELLERIALMGTQGR